MIKVKVFYLTKYTEEKHLPLYRCMEESENIYSIKLKENIPFNHLIITNPENSNSIYILHQLNFRSNESNILKLYMADNITEHSNWIKDGILKYSCLDNKITESNMTELSTATSTSSLLNDNYLILVPGGNIVIKTNTPILKAELSMNYTTEEL